MQKYGDPDPEGFVLIGDVVHANGLGQTQYASRYTHGQIPEYPNLCEGMNPLRILPNHNWHAIKIHADDAETFVARVNTYRAWEHSLWEITQNLLRLAESKTQGRGMLCVHDIVMDIRRCYYARAKATCFNESDKLSTYPEIKELIKKLFWSWEEHPWSFIEELQQHREDQE